MGPISAITLKCLPLLFVCLVLAKEFYEYDSTTSAIR